MSDDSDETYLNFGKNNINKRYDQKFINNNSNTSSQSFIKSNNDYSKSNKNLSSNNNYSQSNNNSNASNYKSTNHSISNPTRFTKHPSSQYTNYTQKDVDKITSKSNNYDDNSISSSANTHLSALLGANYKAKIGGSNNNNYSYNSSLINNKHKSDIKNKNDNPINIYETFSDEQKKVYKAALDGENVFFTGCAGTGKSYVLKAIINALPVDLLAITASTGIASLNIGGLTLHSWSGIGIGTDTAKALASKILKNVAAKARWDTCKTLIIDEISMLDGLLFDKLEEVARILKRNENPFGGIQLILCGDFLQLPPVKADLMCFESAAFNRCLPSCILLRAVFRQNDDTFVKVLGQLRCGNVTNEAIKMLNSCINKKLDLPDGIQPTKLCPLKTETDKENQQRLSEIAQTVFSFPAQDSGQEFALANLKNNCPAVESLVLKVGAQVLLLRNLDLKVGLANGSRGVIIDFVDCLNNKITKKCPLVRFVNGLTRSIEQESFKVEARGVTLAERIQVPLALAWAITIHKCQGMTLDAAELKLDKCFETGQGYVALSRLRSLDSVCILSLDGLVNWERIFRVNNRALKYYSEYDSDIDLLKSAERLNTEVKIVKPNHLPSRNSAGTSFYNQEYKPLQYDYDNVLPPNANTSSKFNNSHLHIIASNAKEPESIKVMQKILPSLSCPNLVPLKSQLQSFDTTTYSDIKSYEITNENNNGGFNSALTLVNDRSILSKRPSPNSISVSASKVHKNVKSLFTVKIEKETPLVSDSARVKKKKEYASINSSFKKPKHLNSDIVDLISDDDETFEFKSVQKIDLDKNLKSRPANSPNENVLNKGSRLLSNQSNLKSFFKLDS